jgi:hypothetical protein
MPALDALPPSLIPLDEVEVLSWLQAAGTIVTVHKARSMKAATSLKPEAMRR